MMRVVFIGMALALAVGGLAGVFGTGVFGGGGSGNPQDFVIQDDDNSSLATPQPQTTAEGPTYASLPPMTIDLEKRYVATIKTGDGEIQVELFADQAPQTVNNFVFLAQAGFYNGLSFQQVFEGFSAQAGDPGDGGPTYDLPQEESGSYKKGTLGMATASQFFIAFTESKEFEQFTSFGQIISGLDVAEQLTQGIEIQSVEIAEE
jgi:cyclophilin family peptidyl-prolyl cis-trans isomerase